MRLRRTADRPGGMARRVLGDRALIYRGERTRRHGFSAAQRLGRAVTSGGLRRRGGPAPSRVIDDVVGPGQDVRATLTLATVAYHLII